MSPTRRPDEMTGVDTEGPVPAGVPPVVEDKDVAARRDATRCRHVEDALYRRARGYKVSLKKTFKVKRAEYDPATGKKVAEREELETGVEEVHIPADVRVCAYYLNNRDPARWQEHPREEPEDAFSGMVEYPPMATATLDADEGEVVPGGNT